MRCSVVVLPVLLGLLACGSVSKTAPILSNSATAERSARSPPPSSISGETWRFCGLYGMVTFDADGSVQFTELDCGDARWVQHGAHVRFDCNGFTNYDVMIRGSEMRGEWYRFGDPSERSETCLDRVP
jgi:hypothetical protein